MGIYTSLEDKWYDLVDWLDQYIPIGGVVDKVDKIVPSFILVLILIFIILLLGIFAINSTFGKIAEVVVVSKNGVPLEGVSVTLTDGCGGEIVLTTNAIGKAETKICSTVVAVVAKKEGYITFSDDLIIENGKGRISLSPVVQIIPQRNFHAEVRDASGAIIPSATLELVCISSPNERTALGTQKASGFDFNISTSCTTAQLKASATSYAEQTVNLTQTDERKVITLQKVDISATLLVEASDSHGIETQADIIFTNNDTKASVTYTTDIQGKKTIKIDAGTYTYSASTALGQNETGTLTISPKQTQTLEIVFEYVSPQVVNDSNVIYLQIMADANTPIQGASVTLYRDGNLFGTLSSGYDGKTTQRIILPEQNNSKFYALINSTLFELKILEVKPQAKISAPTIITLRKGGANLKVKTIDDANVPLRSSTVALTHSQTGLVLATYITDANGDVLFSRLPQGSYKLDALDSSQKIEAHDSVSVSTDATVQKTLVLVTGTGSISFKFINYSGEPQNPSYSIYTVASGDLNLIATGVAKSGSVSSPRVSVGTKIKLVVEDGNYFSTETPIFEVTRAAQTKNVYLIGIDELPNPNKVQMFLNNIYSTDPLYGSPIAATKLIPGTDYYFEYGVLLNLDNGENSKLISDFFVGPKDINIIQSNTPMKISSIYSIGDYVSLLTSVKRATIIDPISQASELVDTSAKQANILLDTKAPRLIPVVVRVNVDVNATGKVTMYFDSIYGTEQSLQYKTDLNIGTTFCFNSNNCPEIAFNNWVKWTDIKGNVKETPLTNDPYLIYVGDTYSIRTITQNLSDKAIGDVNLVLTIPKESIDSYTFLNDKNKVNSQINLSPLGESIAITTPLVIIKSGSSSEKITQYIEKLVGGVNEFKNLNENNNTLKFNVKTKNQLEIDISPNQLFAGVNYPQLLVKTKYTGQKPVSAHWYAEQIDSLGNSLTRNLCNGECSGTTDANGYQIISLSTLNLQKNDRIRFVAYDDNGALDGNKIFTITPAVDIPPAPYECLSVTVGGTNISTTSGYSTRVEKGSAIPVTLVSDCNETRTAGVFTDLISSELQTTINAHATKTLTITATPNRDLLGAFPVQIVSINGSSYSQIGYFDVDVFDSSSCFDLTQAIFDLKTTGTISSSVVNNCFSGRKDNFYPKMDISTKSVGLTYHKPGNPPVVTFKATVIGSSVEALVQGFGWGEDWGLKNQGPGCHPEDLELGAPAELYGVEAQNSICAAAVEDYKSLKPTPIEEPDLDITDPTKPFYALPVATQNAVISQIHSESGTWASTTPTTPAADANLSSDTTKKAKVASFDFWSDVGDAATDLTYDTLTGGGYTVYETSQGNSTFVTRTTGTAPPGNVSFSGTAPADDPSSWAPDYLPKNYDGSSASGGPYLMPYYPAAIGSPGITDCHQLEYSMGWVAWPRPEGWFDCAGAEYSECYKGGGEKPTGVATLLELHNCSDCQVSYVGLGEESIEGVLYARGYLEGCSHWYNPASWWDSCAKTATIKIQPEFYRVLTPKKEQRAVWEKDVNLNTTEGKPQDMGSYQAQPVPYWTNMSTVFDHAQGDTWTEDGRMMTALCTQGIGFIPLAEAGCGEEACFDMADPADPLVEYDPSGYTKYWIPTPTVPDDIRVFLKDGSYFAEYIGKPEVAGKNIDFNITKVNLEGNEYALITVQDWTNGTTKTSQQFQVKLSGPPTSCYSNDGIEGMTGREFVPKLLFNWDWNSINADTCLESNSNYIYCDGTQFTMNLFTKINQLNGYLQKGQLNDYTKNSSFKAYLIRDNYNQNFLDDFKKYYSETFANAPDYFRTTVTKPGLDKFITDHKITFKTDTGTTTLPYGGLYFVEININLNDKGIPSLFNGNNTNATIEVTLRPVQQAPNYNPFYEMPFDGEVGRVGETFIRNGYGAAVTGSGLRLNATVDGHEYSSALKTLNTQEITNLNQLQNSKILTVNSNGTASLMLTQPTPVFMTVTGNTGKVTAQYSYAGSYSDTMALKQWKLMSSTLSANSKCADFSGNNQYLFDDITFGSSRGLSWDSTKSGTLGLVTTYYTPKDVESTIRVTPLTTSTNTTFNSFAYVKNNTTVMLNNFDAQQIEDYDTLQGIFNNVASENICMSKNGSSEVQFWWNPDYISTLERQVNASTGSQCYR